MTKIQDTTDTSKYMLTVDEAELTRDLFGKDHFAAKCYIDGHDHEDHIEASISWEAVEKEADMVDFTAWYWENRYTEELYSFIESAINKAQGRTINYKGNDLPDLVPHMDAQLSNIQGIAKFWKSKKSA